MKSLGDVDLDSKNVMLRTDLNLPIEDGEPQKTVRFERYLETVRELSDRGARTLIVAHQGRPSRKDFTSLKHHAEILSDELGREVDLVQSFFGSELGEAVASMQDGDVKLLENVRFLSEELQNMPPERHARDFFVENAEKYFDLYVNDAFSAAHRSHASLVGFNKHLESAAGPVMRRELENCRSIRDEQESPVLVLGGEKPSDIVGVLEKMVEGVEKVLLGGIPGELALMIQGKNLGKKEDWIRDRGLDSSEQRLRSIMEEHSEKFVVPQDLVAESGTHPADDLPGDAMTWDIGPETAEKYAGEIERADTVLMKGPMGAFEEHPDGSRRIVDAMSESEAFTVLGGGHTSSLVHRFGNDLDDFSHVSIAGGAFVRFMSGEELPAIEALKSN
ncbi:MAG: phosphoglycerate kinase [Candidatus Nanohaloarchaea archaeon]